MKSPMIVNVRETCTSCAGTMILEFAALSRLTGKPIFETTARRAMDYLWQQRHRSSDLVGTVLNIHNGDWVRRDSGVGAGIDSYYEYLFKGYILLGDETYLHRFNKHYRGVMKYISIGPLLIDVHMHRPQNFAKNFMDSLLAFWPGLQVLMGDIKPAIATHEVLYQVLQRHNYLMPEAFSVNDFEPYWTQYFLRPEFIESTYFLYKATGNHHYLEVGKKIMRALQKFTRTRCGFAAVKDVRTGVQEDRMDSFFLTETMKYLYLLFAKKDDIIIDLDQFVFTTEAHFLPLSLSSMGNENVNLSSQQKLRLEKEDVDLGDERDEDEYGEQFRRLRTCPRVKQTKNDPKSADHVTNIRKQMRNFVSVHRSIVGRNDDPRLKARETSEKCSIENGNERPALTPANFVVTDQSHIEQLKRMGITVKMTLSGMTFTHEPMSVMDASLLADGKIFMNELGKRVALEDSLLVRHLVWITLPDGTSLHFKAGSSEFGQKIDEVIFGNLAIAVPFKACRALKGAFGGLEEMVGYFVGRFVIVQRGGCNFIEKARNVQIAGGAAMIVVDNNVGTSSDNTAMNNMVGDGVDDVHIPAVFIFHKEGWTLINHHLRNPDLKVGIRRLKPSDDEKINLNLQYALRSGEANPKPILLSKVADTSGSLSGFESVQKLINDVKKNIVDKYEKYFTEEMDTNVLKWFESLKENFSIGSSELKEKKAEGSCKNWFTRRRKDFLDYLASMSMCIRNL